MRAAFYAPLKPPDDPIPSGDRAMAQALMSALNAAGFSPDLASRFRSREAHGDQNTQLERLSTAKIEIRKILDKKVSKYWRFWLTYHNYYKAPDLIGPAISKALNIPYVLIEASRARKRFDGPWDTYARAAEAATDAASCVFYLTQHDAEALHKYRASDQQLVHLPPFLNRPALPNITPCPPKLLSVGMFRAGDKLQSYRLVADTLRLLSTSDWHLTIAGDGPKRNTVEQLMAPFGARVAMLGALGSDAMRTAYQNAGILLWPGVNEAFGMSYLEAQAAGLAVVAQDRPGVRDVLAPVLDYPVEEDGPKALAALTDDLLTNDVLRKNAGQMARQFIAQNHLLQSAAAKLQETIGDILE